MTSPPSEKIASKVARAVVSPQRWTLRHSTTHLRFGAVPLVAVAIFDWESTTQSSQCT